MGLGGASRDSTGLECNGWLVQWKRASSRLEAGTSGLLSFSDLDCRVTAE